MNHYGELENQVDSMAPGAARDLLTRLAEAGDAAAQCLLADSLDAGTLDIRDQELSVAWYRQSAAQGFTRAEFYLGSMIAFGFGTTTDLDEAAVWFRRAAAKGDPAAQYRLGELLVSNQVRPAPGEQGVAQLKLAAAQNHGDAIALLERLHAGT